MGGNPADSAVPASSESGGSLRSKGPGDAAETSAAGLTLPAPGQGRLGGCRHREGTLFFNSQLTRS